MERDFVQPDVIIAGGGLAGLSAACYLTRGGKTVTLYEKASNMGGRAATQQYEGYSFNRGVHALYSGGALERGFKELGIPITDSGHSPTELWALRQGKFYDFPSTPRSLLRTGILNAAGKWELLRLLLTLPMLHSNNLRQVSVQQWLERATHNTQVRQVLAALSRTLVYSAALDLVSADVLVDKLQRSLMHPILYIDGGWQTLVDGLRRAAEQAGVQIVGGTHVEAVIHRDGRAEGVRLRDGRTVPSSAVILATTPHDAVQLIDGGTYAPLRRIVDAIVPAQVACLDVALRRLPNPHHLVVQDVDHPRFLTVQSCFSRVAPAGGALIYTFKQLDPAHPSDPRDDERDLEDLLDTVQPGWRDVVVKRQYLPRMEGASLLPVTHNGGFAGRPGPQVPGFANLYLAGDWIGSEGFLADASIASARQVAHLLLQNRGSLQRRQQEPALVGTNG